jgi:hypothetical protein
MYAVSPDGETTAIIPIVLDMIDSDVPAWIFPVAFRNTREAHSHGAHMLFAT